MPGLGIPGFVWNYGHDLNQVYVMRLRQGNILVHYLDLTQVRREISQLPNYVICDKTIVGK